MGKIERERREGKKRWRIRRKVEKDGEYRKRGEDREEEKGQRKGE